MSLLHWENEYYNIDSLVSSIKRNHLSNCFIVEAGEYIDKKQFAADIVKAMFCKEKPGMGCGHCIDCNKVQTYNHEDIYYVESPKCVVKVDDIRKLINNMARVSKRAERNIGIIVNADTMNSSSQNALLKTLEEPIGSNIIFLLVENRENLLQTIKSRSAILRLKSDESLENLQEYESSIALLEKVIDGNLFHQWDDEIKEKTKTKAQAEEFIKHLLHFSKEVLLKEDPRHRNLSHEQILKVVECAGKAMEELEYNTVNEYVVKKMLIKIGGNYE